MATDKRRWGKVLQDCLLLSRWGNFVLRDRYKLLVDIVNWCRLRPVYSNVNRARELLIMRYQVERNLALRTSLLVFHFRKSKCPRMTPSKRKTLVLGNFI